MTAANSHDLLLQEGQAHLSYQHDAAETRIVPGNANGPLTVGHPVLQARRPRLNRALRTDAVTSLAGCAPAGGRPRGLILDLLEQARIGATAAARARKRGPRV
jgi:hypothetical protein